MELSALAQVGTMVLAALAIVWHQQKSNDKLRDDMRIEISGVRSETSKMRTEQGVMHGELDVMRSEQGVMRGELGEVRGELGEVRGELGTLRLIVTENGQRLARIEGYLGIGMPSEAATAAAGAEAPRTTQGPNG